MMYRLSISYIRKGLTLVCFCLAIGLTLDSCGSSKNTVLGSQAQRVDKNKHKQNKTHKNKPKAGPGATHQLADALLDEARSWLGTPYKYGGQDKNGADCSGFIMEVYRKVTGVKIPRNSGKQKEYCADINRKDLTVGDLLFFSSRRSNGDIAHVGMYVGEGQMIHASSSRGVIESPIDQNYWNEHYKGSGRIPLIAQLVPIPQTQQPIELPMPEAPLISETITDSQKNTSLTDNEPTIVTKPIVAQAKTPEQVESPLNESDLAVVTVTSAFADASSTRPPLTRKTKTKNDITANTAENNKNITKTEDNDETPAVIVRNAFGAASHD